MSARAIAGCLLLASCGYGPPLTLACQDVAQARCAKRASCSDGGSIVMIFGDQQTCLQREQLACMLQSQAPGVNAAPLALEACAIAFEQVTCADFFATRIPAACPAVGTRAMGAPCAYDPQCASGYCGASKTAVCGACAAPPVAGAPCVSSNCARGFQCPPRTFTCADVPLQGMPCDLSAMPCGADLACVSVNGAAPTCEPALGLGAPCGGALGNCDTTRGLVCDGISASTRACRPLPFLGDGKPCGILPNGTIASCAAGGCYGDAGVAPVGESGACKANAADGQPCDATLGPECVHPARCIVTGGSTAGICTLPSPASCG
ncbi:MAG TPA: hypothetical protein VFF06_10695 [Polyangia bacterium]|nr:hypothetical protein [Polyangia bacterium]